MKDLRNEIAKELFLDAIHAKREVNIIGMAQSALTIAEMFMDVLRKHDEKAVSVDRDRSMDSTFENREKGCHSCHGAGKYRQHGNKQPTTCKTCKGSGMITYAHPTSGQALKLQGERS